MKEGIRQRARELGFDDCRFTDAAAPESAPRFLEWINSRQHGEMAYLERNAQKRVDLRKVLPGAKTVIALAASYAREGTSVEGRGSPSRPSSLVPRPSPHGTIASAPRTSACAFARLGPASASSA